MHYSKSSILAFIDGDAPFNDEAAARMWNHPIIRNMSLDIYELYDIVDNSNAQIVNLCKIISKQRKLMFLGSTLCVGAGYLIYLREEKARGKQAKAEEVRDARLYPK